MLAETVPLTPLLSNSQKQSHQNQFTHSLRGRVSHIPHLSGQACRLHESTTIVSPHRLFLLLPTVPTCSAGSSAVGIEHSVWPSR